MPSLPVPPLLTTPRLFLTPLTRALVQTRLVSDSFDAAVRGPDGPCVVTFPAAWPGDALAIFPMLRDGSPDEAFSGSYVVVERLTRRAVGQLGTKGPPDSSGAQEIGYGMNPEVWGQGLGTEAVGALVADLLTAPGLRTVSAQTLPSNRASERLLEKLGFVQVGHSWDEEDGNLNVWHCTATLLRSAPPRL